MTTTWLKHPLARVLLGGAALVIVVVGGFAYYYLGNAGGHATAGPVVAPTLSATNGATIYTIDATASTASFTINEIHFGSPNTVVGKTNQVAGQIAVNQTQPTHSQVGTIKVDVSALATDNAFRNRALQGSILETGVAANQYATFVPTGLSGLPASIAIGQAVSFTINGNLTIHQVTRPAVFAVTATLTDAKTLTGHARTTVKYADFNIAIPSVPSVTGVGDTVILALDFTARA